MSLVNYIPMMNVCPRDLGMSLENYIPMMDLYPRDMGMSLKNHPQKHKFFLLNTKGSQIVRILICLKYDLQPKLGSELLRRWRLRPTLPGSRVTRRT